MARIFEAYPTLRYMSNAPPPYSEPTLPPTPAPPLITQAPRLWKDYGNMDDWSKSPAGRKAISQLCRYLMEVLAFTFEAEMTTFNAALGQIENIKTTLSEAEHASLLALALLIRSMRAKVGKPEWLTIPNDDCTTVIKAVSKPVKFLNLPNSFVFKLLASYADHQCDPSRWTMTLVAQRIPWLTRYRSIWGDGLRALRATVRSHVDVARLIAHDEEVRKLLGEAMIKWQERRGLEGLVIEGRDGSTGDCWDLVKAVYPCEGGFW
jgi:hypothetical protein